MPTITQLKTIAFTFAILWALTNVGVLSPVKDFMKL